MNPETGAIYHMLAITPPMWNMDPETIKGHLVLKEPARLIPQLPVKF